MSRTPIDAGIDRIDSRDVLDEIKLLELEDRWVIVQRDGDTERWWNWDEGRWVDDIADTTRCTFDEQEDVDGPPTVIGWSWELDGDEQEYERLVRLRELIDLMENASMDSATDGIFAIEDSDFEDYAQELAEEVCADWRLIRDSRWPFSCIDWEKAADELKVDYTEFEWQGYTYWTR